MPLQRYLFTVYLQNPGDPDPVEHPVEVRHGDLLRAELEAGRQKLPVDPRLIPQQTTALWVWAALVREGIVTVDYRTFRDGNTAAGTPPILVHIERQTDPATGDPAVVEVPPTEPDSEQPWSSLPGSETSPGGSTPTPTSS